MTEPPAFLAVERAAYEWAASILINPKETKATNLDRCAAAIAIALLKLGRGNDTK